jgi:hypothetical protein
MLELNKLFLDAYVMVNKFFQKNHVNYYPTSVGSAYKELFHRDAFACLSFYDANNEQYYLYFNSAYNRDINRMVFTSIAIVSRENLNIGKADLELKAHIENISDVENLLKTLKGVI